MIKVVNIFLTQQFQRKKCDLVVRIFPSTQRCKVQSFSQLFLPTNKMDEKIHRHLNNFFKLVALRKQLPWGKEDQMLVSSMLP
jgi:hypothetical protein